MNIYSLIQLINNDFPANGCPGLDGFAALDNIQVPNIQFTLNYSRDSNGGSSPSVGNSPSVGYVRECIVNAAFDYIGQFDVYRLVAIGNVPNSDVSKLESVYTIIVFV